MNSSLPNVCGTFLIIATGVTSLKPRAEFGRRVQTRPCPIVTMKQPRNAYWPVYPAPVTRYALRKYCCLLSAHRRAVLSQPRCQLRFLSRLQVDAVVDAFDRLAIGPLRSFDLVRSKKLHAL